MKRRTLIRCISLAPLATGASRGRPSSPGKPAEKLPPGHDPRDFGGLADGRTLDTAAIQAAIDAAASSLGRVNLTGAVFLSDSPTLRSGISFHIPLDELHRVPEHPDRYPEFSMFGELAAWGLFRRQWKTELAAR